MLAAYKVATGERIYQERLGGTGGSFSASPVAADGKIYLSSEDGDVFVVKAGPAYELLAKNPVGEVLMASPAISDGLIIFRGQKNVIAIKAAEIGTRIAATARSPRPSPPSRAPSQLLLVRHPAFHAPMNRVPGPVPPLVLLTSRIHGLQSRRSPRSRRQG